MTRYVVYQYDQKTGFINGTNASERKDDDPFLTLPGHLALTDYIVATTTTKHPDRPDTATTAQVHGNGYSFLLDEAGKPAEDDSGNYVLVPPAWSVIPPTVHDYAVLGHIRAGHLDPQKDLHPAYVTGLNRALAAAGASPIPGIEVLATPVRTCSTDSVNLKPDS